MSDLYFDDFKPGDRFESAGKTLSESEILDFAWRYDPQPIHMDVGAAADGPYGGLIASGFQTLVVGFRMLWQSGREPRVAGHGRAALAQAGAPRRHPAHGHRGARDAALEVEARPRHLPGKMGGPQPA